MEQPSKLFNRNFFLLWQGNLISRIGTNVYGVSMALFLKHATESATLMGLMWMVSGLPIIFLGPIAGTVADRYQRRRILIFGDLFNGIAVTIFSIFLFITPETSNLLIVGLFAVAIFIGVINAFYMPAISAAIPDIVPKDKLAGANSMGQISIQFSTFVGQGIGAALYAIFGAAVVCMINGVSYLYAGFSKSFIRIPQRIPKKTDDWREQFREFKEDLLEGFKYVWHNKGLRTLIYIAAFTNLFSTPIMPLLPFYVEDFLHVGPQWYGFFLAATGLGALLGYSFAGIIKFSPGTRGNIMMLFIIAQSVGYGILGFITVPYIAILMAIIGGFTTGYVSVHIAVTLQLTTPSEIRGRVIALLTTLVGSLTPIGMGLGGFIGDLLDRNIPLIYASCGAIMFILTIIAAMNTSFRQFLSYDHEIELKAQKKDMVLTDLAG